MTPQPTVTRPAILTAVLAFIMGWLLAAFVLGTPISLNPILLAFVLLLIILVLRVHNWIVVLLLVIGALVTVLIPSLAPGFIDRGVLFGILLFLSLKL